MRRLTPYLILLLPALSQAQSPLSRAASIGRVDSIQSATLKENRRYLVYTPPFYEDTTFAPRKYPVLYLLDGNAHFHSVTGLLQILGTGVNGTFVVPEMIVVAIPNTDRTRDLTPTNAATRPDGRPNPALSTSGGMPTFFTFLKDELIPQIEARYRTMPYRVFVGHSFGGIATLNALYTIPETFNAYVAIDPSLWWDNQLLLRKARPYFSTARLAGKALYVAQANTINADDTTSNVHFSSITQFNGVMEAYNTSGLRYAYKYYASDDHGSVPLIAEYDALRFIFEGFKIDVPRVVANPRRLLAQYRELSARLGATFTPSEAQLALIGRVVLAQDSTKALDLYQMAIDFFPASHYWYDNIGDVWNARGDRAKARSWYEQSLSKKPGGKHAVEMLAKLRQ